MKKITLILALIIGFVNSNLFAQPANDGCSGAINLGSLPTPGACVSGLQNGAVTTVTGTTVTATVDNPFIFQSGCQGSSTTMNAPSIDVWYKFTATGTTLNISVTGFPNANVALWSGTGCGNLNGYNCSVGTAGGTTSLIATQIQIGSTYYISIGGNTDIQTSTFTLNVDNDIDCNNCMRQSSITASPLPVNGAYDPGQTVQFCFKVTQWEIQNTNWFHGVQITMGSGWTGAITSTTVPAACQGSGTWVFKPTGIGVVNGVNWGPGFYFESSGSATNPADNFGDFCSGTGLNWTFCFTLTVKPGCSPGSDLGVDINTSGDGESGSWSSAGCAGDYPTTFNAIGTCCPPTMTSTVTCINASTGTATATPIGAMGPYQYLWSPGGQTTQTATGLTPGTYQVSLTDVNLCERFATIIVPSNPLPVVPITAPITYCLNATTIPLTATPASGCTLNWYGTNATGGVASPTSPTPSSAVVGTTTYYVSQTTALGCEGPRATIVVTISPLPVVTVNSPIICAGATATLTAVGATTYSWNSGVSTANPYSVTPTVTTTYTVIGTTLGCTGTATATVTVNPLPVVTVNSPTICPTVTAILTASGATTYSWDGGVSTTNPYSVTPAVTTTYTVVGTTLGCTGTAIAIVTISNALTVTVNSPSVCFGSTAILTATGGTTYSWDGGVSTANPYSVTPLVTTSYVVTGTSNGCTGTATATVTVNPLALAPTTAPITYCQNATTVPLTATPTAGCTLNWYGTNATGGIASPTSPTPSSAVAGTTTYYVSQTTALGCEGPRATIVVTINPLPVVTVNSPTVCAGSTAILTASGGTTYSWDGGVSTANPYSVTPAVTTTYTVVGTTLGCTGTATATVTVNPLPVVTVNSPSVCPTVTAILTASGATTYSWDGGVSTTNPYSVTPTVTTTYTVIGTTLGCTGTATATVTINPLPVAPTTAPITYCQNAATVPLTATPTAGCTLNWYGTNATGGVASPTAPSPSSTVVGTTTYYVSQTSALGCEGPRATIDVTINALPIVTVNSPTICPTTTAVLTAAGATTYSWDGGVSTANPYSVTPATTTTYTVVGTTLGCTGTATATVTILNALTVAVNSPSICAGSTAVLTATGGTTYSWDGGVSTANPYSVTPTVTTTYTVVGTTNGCTGTATATVTVNPLPVAPITTPVQYCVNDVATSLIATALTGNALNWYGTNAVGGVASSIAPIPSTAMATTITYYVSQTVISAGCEGPRATLVVTINPLPVAPITAPVQYCLNDSPSPLLVAPLAGNTLNWYGTNATGGIASSISPTPNTSVAGTTTYYVSQTNATTGCEGPRASLDVTVNPLPDAPLTIPIVYCINDVAAPLTAAETAIAGTTYTLNWYGTSSVGGVSSSSAPVPNTSVAGTTTYYVS